MAELTFSTKSKPSARRRIARTLVTIFTIPCVIYMALLTYLYFNQRALIFPGSLSQNKTNAHLSVAPSGCELLDLPTGQGKIAAIFGRAETPDGAVDPSAGKRPTVLYFYGNGGSIVSSLEQMKHFQKLDMNVLVADYPGFGMSPGVASEEACYGAADAVYRYARARPEIDPAKLIVAGWSLGSAVAIDLASKHPCAGLITFSAFTSMAEMGNSQYPIVPLPIIRAILKYRFASEEKIRRVGCPVLIGHSRDDHFVPYRMADRLASAAGGPATRLTTVGSDHSDFFANDSPQIFEAIGKFVHQTLR
ncbi:hypothetical protein CCAX7_12630 [Capsulimonas corticalis]|uniref:Uncharacterized protein n=1 Tax=Capsulimonas corticalis TaxID=2219043 RepID=A0A402D4B7_9BACT|nr:alpha/beta hydrolase [Capsulimonas corticalis]BDI29212.1 hypothetical protein CCAX7_12630 [Capsulimonas corticalis]